jgi:hypothetical protein
MPSVDRKWRLTQRIGYGMIAFMALLLAAAVTLYVVPFISGWLNWRTWAPPTQAQQDWAPLWLCLSFVGWGVVLVRTANGGRERERLRALALAGDAGAMPQSAIKPLLAPPADTTHQPLMLLWRP